MISPLLTDLYQLTMAYGYWKLGIHERESVFHLIFRKNPFHGNYAISCGLAGLIEFLNQWQFTADDLAYLAKLQTPKGGALFPSEFLEYLATLRFTCDVDAIPEGTLVFSHEPLVRISGPLLQAQLVESTLLNIINFQTLIATKASRVCQAAQGEPVLEFGMRRAQGPDGALSASRAAYIGGCVATSNVLAGKLYDIPVRGTHGHSWVTAFSDEMTAFEAYAKVMPHNCILLVDTYNTISGILHAIEIGKKLRDNGADLLGIRLDSGNLAELSIKARQMLDAAGFQETKILASNSLDEYSIAKLKNAGAQISVWGVGTHLATAYDYPALDGVYKLSALRDEQGHWQYKLKLSEQAVKISNPGIYQVRRFFQDGEQAIDVMYDIELGIPEPPKIQSLVQDKMVELPKYDKWIDLLQPIFQKGKLVYTEESIHHVRERAMAELAKFLKNYDKKEYLLGLERQLHELKQGLISEAQAKF